jgi:hypothetical protein
VVRQLFGRGLHEATLQDLPTTQSAYSVHLRWTEVLQVRRTLTDRPDVKRQRTPEEIADEESRTTAMGLYNTACSYHLAARELERLKLRWTHPSMPVELLYFHTIELFLKAFLQLTHSVAELSSRNFGHQLPVLAKAAKENKLFITKKDMAVIGMCDLDLVFGARYIKTGYRVGPTPEDLLATCDRLRKRVKGQLRKRKIMVRN